MNSAARGRFKLGHNVVDHDELSHAGDGRIQVIGIALDGVLVRLVRQRWLAEEERTQDQPVVQEDALQFLILRFDIILPGLARGAPPYITLLQVIRPHSNKVALSSIERDLIEETICLSSSSFLTDGRLVRDVLQEHIQPTLEDVNLLRR